MSWEPKTYWENHPRYPLTSWKSAVDASDTRMGYVDWVNSRLRLDNTVVTLRITKRDASLLAYWLEVEYEAQEDAENKRELSRLMELVAATELAEAE